MSCPIALRRKLEAAAGNKDWRTVASLLTSPLLQPNTAVVADAVEGAIRAAVADAQRGPAESPRCLEIILMLYGHSVTHGYGRRAIGVLARAGANVAIMDQCLALANPALAGSRVSILNSAMDGCCRSGDAAVARHLAGLGAGKSADGSRESIDFVYTAAEFGSFAVVDALLACGMAINNNEYYRSFTRPGHFTQVFVRAPLAEYPDAPRGWYETHGAEIPEWRRQHSLRADAAVLEGLADADAIAVDGVITQSLDTSFALIVLRDIVLRQLRVDLRESCERVPGL